MPEISLIVPVYKVEPYLSRCVNSVLAQTWTDFELILVDDGSPDRCGELCEAFAAKDARVHVIHRVNGGLSAARNTGIEWALAHSDSEWISFLDSDDWVHPRYLEALLQAVSQTGLSLAVGGFRRTEKDGDQLELPADLTARAVDPEEFYCTDKLTATVAWGKLYKKRDFSQIRYPEGKIHEDELTTHKLLFRYDRIALVDQPLYQYFQNQQGIMRSGWSPKHLAEVEGIADQLTFFLEKGRSDAARKAARAYINSLDRNLAHARRGGPQYEEETNQLRRQLRGGLKQYGSLAGFDRRSAPWLYYEAFPIRTIPERLWKRLFKKS